MSKQILLEKITENQAVFDAFHVNGSRQSLREADKEVFKAIFSSYPQIKSFEITRRAGGNNSQCDLSKINGLEIYKSKKGVASFFDVYHLVELPELKSLIIELNITESLFIDFCDILFISFGKEAMNRNPGKHERIKYE